MAGTSVVDYYNSRANFDKLNPLIRSAYNTTFDFEDYKKKLLTKVDNDDRHGNSSVPNSIEEIRQEQRVRLAQVEHDYYTEKKKPISFDVPFYPQEVQEEQKYEIIIASKPPKPTASRRSPSPVFVTEEPSQHHIHHRPLSANIVQRHDDDDDIDFCAHQTYTDHITTKPTDDLTTSHIENHIENMWNEYELEDYMEERKYEK